MTAPSITGGRASGSNPRGNWGPGAVQLVEIPTDDEIHDNIVAYWRPDARHQERRQPGLRLPALLAGQRARTIPTTLPGWWRPGWASAAYPARRLRRATSANSSSTCTGGPLTQMQQRYDITPVANASRGKIDNAYVIKVVGTDRWRALFDLQWKAMRRWICACSSGWATRTLSETWLYQYFP